MTNANSNIKIHQIQTLLMISDEVDESDRAQSINSLLIEEIW